MARKKNIEAPESLPVENGIPVARQVHRVTTTYTKTVPVEEIETKPDPEPDPELVEYASADDLEDDPECLTLPPYRQPSQVESGDQYPDAIGEMLRDLQVEKRQFSWTMIVERLPNFEKDARHDAGARRINCGTRPMSVDFIEDIRSQFARPNKANHFRVLIKKNGRIHAHWPEVISLEPPPPEVIAEVDRTAPTTASPAPYIPTPPGFSETIEHLKELAKLRTVLFSEVSGGVANPPAQLTEEAALLKLITSNSDVIGQFSEKISKRLFGAPEPSEADSWGPVIKSALDNGPAIIQQLFAGLRDMRQPAPPMFTPGGFPAPPPVAPPPPQPAPPTIAPERGPSPEIALLGTLIQYRQADAPAAAAAAFADSFAAQHPEVNPLIDSFLEMSPADCLSFLESFFPQAAPVLRREGSPEWIEQLQKALSTEEPDNESA
jgi:hypothetical protein